MAGYTRSTYRVGRTLVLSSLVRQPALFIVIGHAKVLSTFRLNYCLSLWCWAAPQPHPVRPSNPVNCPSALYYIYACRLLVARYAVGPLFGAYLYLLGTDEASIGEFLM